MASKTTTIITLLSISITLSLHFTTGSATKPPNLRHARGPCKWLVVYFHDIRYNGSNADNATSAIVGEPAWGDKTSLTGGGLGFGDMIAFDDPLTADGDLHSPPVGRAQGFYLYDGMKEPRAWHGFSMVFNNTRYKGIITLAGLNIILNKTREIPVIGGTGDFFMHRGVATFTTDAREGLVYFRIRIDVKLYECWRLVA